MYSNNALTSDSILKIDAIYKYEGDTATEKLLFFSCCLLKSNSRICTNASNLPVARMQL